MLALLPLVAATMGSDPKPEGFTYGDDVSRDKWHHNHATSDDPSQYWYGHRNPRHMRGNRVVDTRRQLGFVHGDVAHEPKEIQLGHNDPILRREELEEDDYDALKFWRREGWNPYIPFQGSNNSYNNWNLRWARSFPGQAEEGIAEFSRTPLTSAEVIGEDPIVDSALGVMGEPKYVHQRGQFRGGRSVYRFGGELALRHLDHNGPVKP